MKLLKSTQLQTIDDAVRSKFALTIPILEATLHSLPRNRITRLGGLEKITLADLAREFRAGDGDTGICFEYAVHRALASKHPLIYPLASEVLEKFCKIKNGADSLLFGPEKQGVIPILESIQDALTDDSIIYVGNVGRPPRLKKYIPQVVNAFRRNEARNKLPRSISGLWKADLFLGNVSSQEFVGTTVKINPTQLEGAKGLRIGIYPKKDAKDTPRKDSTLNLIRLPLPYDSAFMESFYKAFFLVRAFLRTDAHVPPPANLPDAEDRYVTKELESRRDFSIVEVIAALQNMAQANLIENSAVETISPTATLSLEEGLVTKPHDVASSEFVSLTPEPQQKDSK